jgi:uncharacterized protein YPO0396
MQNSGENQGYENKPVYWFVILDSARERNDFETAAEAERQLDRLGVKVTFRRPRQEAIP